MRLAWVNHSLDGRIIRSSLTEAEAAELSRLAEGAFAVEIGAAYGFSTIHIAKTARWVVSIDPHEVLRSYEEMMDHLRHFGLASKVFGVCETSQHVLPLLRSGRFDFIFIDGDHTEMAVLHDVEHALRLLRPGGVLAVHDYGEDSCPDVKTAVDLLGLKADRVVDTLFVTTKEHA